MPVQIHFGDRERTLKFGLRACQELEATLGVDGMTDVGTMLSKCSTRAAVACLVAGLKHEDSSLSPNLVTKQLETYIIDEGGNFLDLCNQIWKALEDTKLFEVDKPSGNGSAA
jgi:hypothetical protein